MPVGFGCAAIAADAITTVTIAAASRCKNWVIFPREFDQVLNRLFEKRRSKVSIF
jgi:hypothetical protein